MPPPNTRGLQSVLVLPDQTLETCIGYFRLAHGDLNQVALLHSRDLLPADMTASEALARNLVRPVAACYDSSDPRRFWPEDYRRNLELRWVFPIIDAEISHALAGFAARPRLPAPVRMAESFDTAVFRRMAEHLWAPDTFHWVDPLTERCQFGRPLEMVKVEEGRLATRWLQNRLIVPPQDATIGTPLSFVANGPAAQRLHLAEGITLVHTPGDDAFYALKTNNEQDAPYPAGVLVNNDGIAAINLYAATAPASILTNDQFARRMLALQSEGGYKPVAP